MRVAFSYLLLGPVVIQAVGLFGKENRRRGLRHSDAMLSADRGRATITSDVEAGAAAGANSRSLQSSTLVSIGANNKLVYGGYKNAISYYYQSLDPNADVAGGATNTVPDFSNVGYKGGEEPIPFVPAVVTLTPDLFADDGPQIQGAIDQVSALPLGPDGFRGAILLKAGQYDVFNQLTILASGVVLRGEGSDIAGTVITYTNTTTSTMIFVAGSGGPSTSGPTVVVVDPFVPTGSKTFTVAAGHGFVVGSKIIIKQTPNAEWLLHMSNMAQWGWTTTGYDLEWKRVVTAVDGNQITIHAPLVQPIDANYGGAIVYAYTFSGVISNIGLENMRLESYFANDLDEQHGWKGIQMQQVQDSWIRQVTGKYFGFGLVSIERHSSQITVEDCAMLEHKGTTAGGRRYSFNIDDSEFILFQRCLAQNGRHDFVSGSQTPGPNVWVDCLAFDAINDIGPHHRYSTGQLYDSIRTRDPVGNPGEINVQNRADSGSGHGWAGAQIMFWNCEGTVICDAPNGAMNWATGLVGSHVNSSRTDEPDGIIESLGTHVLPRSLYYAQLQDRLGPNGIRFAVLPAQKTGNVWSELETWYGEGLLMDPVVTWFDEASAPVTPNTPLSIGGIVRDLSFLDAPSTTYQWSQVSGPGTTTFGDASSPETIALFSATGTYVLQLTVTSSVSSATATLTTTTSGSTLAPSTSPPTPAPTPAPVVLYPTDDATIKSASRDSVAGASDRMDVKINDATLDDDRSAYLKFDISGIAGPVSSVTLILFAYTDRVADIALSQTTSNWDENSLTWNNSPGAGTLIESKAYPPQGQPMLFDVTDYVVDQLAASATQVSFVLTALTDDSLVKFYTKEWVTSNVWPNLKVGLGSSSTQAPITVPSPTTSTPTSRPTSAPTNLPTAVPTLAPTIGPAPPTPTSVPTAIPTSTPTSNPTSTPTSSPTQAPIQAPTTNPPMHVPTVAPTPAPTPLCHCQDAPGKRECSDFCGTNSCSYNNRAKTCS